jgi:hypothetical protein
VRGDVKYCIVGNPTEFPAYAEVPLELVRHAAKEFLLTAGQRPTCVQWAMPEIW